MGRLVIVVLLATAVLAGAGMYYLQVYGFYGDIVEGGEVRLTRNAGGTDAILAEEVREIDASSSPLRYRACFTTGMSEAMLTETFVVYDEAIPTVAPEWFECFDAQAIGAALEEERAIAYLGTSNIIFGFDRVVAIDEDGRGYVWHQINSCGEAQFDGDPLPPECPEPPQGTE